MAALSSIRDLLNSSDVAKVVLEANLVSTSETSDAQQRRRILAVVSHTDDWNLTEEGSLFVCMYVRKARKQEELEILHAFPIYGRFSIVMSQMRRGTLDLRPTVSGKSVLEQPRSVISISINPAEGLSDEAQPPTFFTYDVQGLASLVTECKRLRDISDVDANLVVNLASSTTHFSWLKPYFTKRARIETLMSIPQDLRQVSMPLLDRLSPACAGITGDSHEDAKLIRDEWIRDKARDMSRKARRTLRIRLGTFNVNGNLPSQDLSSWIQGNYLPGQTEVVTSSPPSQEPLNPSPISFGDVRKPFTWLTNRTKPPTDDLEPHREEPSLRVDFSDPEDPDMLVLGFQELDLSTEALIYSTGPAREDAWCHAIFAALGEKAVKYEKLVSKQLVGMLIITIVKKSLKDCFDDVKSSVAGAGILGMMGNKGGTAIRLKFTPPFSKENIKADLQSPGSTSLTFVNSHLAAFDEMVDRRNSDFQDLSKRLTFENTLPPSSSEGDAAEDPLNINPTTQPPLTVYETDVLFWMGDLNYRVDIADAQIRRILRDDDWPTPLKYEALLKFDQLKNSMNTKKAFHGFVEAPINHMPSYRFSPGFAMDRLGYDLKRRPAWTDRILHMHGHACQVVQLSYTGHPQITMSDHRPVAADFDVDVDLFDMNVLQSNVSTLYNDVDFIDAESTRENGGLKINETYVDFEKISYGITVERTITVMNNSKIPRAFRFVPIQLDSPILPEWLHIQPMLGVLLPNEVSEITLRAHIDKDTASILNSRPKDLSSTLILHTILGKDHFISVSGEYQYTCFANKLQHLTRLRGSIRSMDSHNDLLAEQNAISAPREIMRLVNWLMLNSNKTDDLFLTPGDDAIVDQIRECLDKGDDFPFLPDTSKPEISLAFATTLLSFLESLVDPLIPAVLHPQCEETTSRDEAFELLDSLHPAAVNVWISVTAYLHFICQTRETENYAERVAALFAPILLRDDHRSAALPISPNGKRKFMLYFIS